jgi:hypothetical protein
VANVKSRSQSSLTEVNACKSNRFCLEDYADVFRAYNLSSGASQVNYRSSVHFSHLKSYHATLTTFDRPRYRTPSGAGATSSILITMSGVHVSCLWLQCHRLIRCIPAPLLLMYPNSRPVHAKKSVVTKFTGTDTTARTTIFSGLYC